KDAILKVLSDAQKPLSGKEIYLRILESQLYNFKAENPEHIVRTLLRRHSENLDFPSAKKSKYFTFLKDGTFWIKDKNLDAKIKTKSPTKENLPYQDIIELQNKYNSIFKRLMIKQ